MRIKQPASWRTMLAASLALLVTACGGGAAAPASSSSAAAPASSAAAPASSKPAGSPASSAKAGSINLRTTVWDGTKEHLAVFNSIADAYKANHPEIGTITFDVLPFDSYTQAVTTQMAGGNPPDLAWIIENSAPDFLASGALYDLSPVMQSTPGYQVNDLSAAALKLWQKDGKDYAYPFSTSPFGVFYNADMFKAAGLPTPDQMMASKTWTWTDLEPVMTKLVAANQGKWAMIVRDWDYKDWTNLATVYRGFGADAWNAAGTQCTFADKPMVDAMTYIHNLIFKDKVMPPPGVQADFFAGQAAMTITQISRASLLKDAKYQWGLVPLPAGPSADAQVIGQAGYAVLAKAPHPKEAADFLAFLTNPENAAKLAAFYPPPRKSLLTAQVLAKANPLLNAQQLQSVVVNGVDTGAVKPAHANFQQISDAVRSALDPLWKPDADVSSVLKSVCSAEQPLLK